jgi:hypothetical protein
LTFKMFGVHWKIVYGFQGILILQQFLNDRYDQAIQLDTIRGCVREREMCLVDVSNMQKYKQYW